MFLNLTILHHLATTKSDLVKLLEGKNRPIFSTSDTKYNPYAPGSEDQFQLPLDIDDSATDDHGKLLSEYLDKIFDYQPVGDPDDDEEIDNMGSTPKLSEDLKDLLAEAYFVDQLVDDLIEYFEDQDDCSLCDWLVENWLEPLRERYFSLGFDRSSLDTSIALIFGNKTTIGQVCSYTRGLEDGTVDDLPGFCCLDAPYQTKPEWGEKVRLSEMNSTHSIPSLLFNSNAMPVSPVSMHARSILSRQTFLLL